MLASDWLGKSGMMADTRSYFVENLLYGTIPPAFSLVKLEDDTDEGSKGVGAPHQCPLGVR